MPIEEHFLLTEDEAGEVPLRCGLVLGHSGKHVDARECWHGMHIGAVERDENGEPTYICSRCDRRVPWSNGALDDTPALCDECATVIRAGEWEDAAGISDANT